VTPPGELLPISGHGLNEFIMQELDHEIERFA